MMRCFRRVDDAFSGPLVHVNGALVWLYCSRYRSRKVRNETFERSTRCDSPCLPRILKKTSTEIDPGRMRRRVMKLHAGMPLEPPAGRRIMDVEVIEHHVQIAAWKGGDDVIHNPRPTTPPTTGLSALVRLEATLGETNRVRPHE